MLAFSKDFGLSTDVVPIVQVQLQTVTAIVKLFLKKPDGAQAIVQKVLQAATKDCDNPDVRDKAYVYWRLLSTDPAAAKVSLCCTGLSINHDCAETHLLTTFRLLCFL